jgi:hypothetical protein
MVVNLMEEEQEEECLWFMHKILSHSVIFSCLYFSEPFMWLPGYHRCLSLRCFASV